MSMLVQKLKSNAESAAPAMGFRTASTVTRARGPLLVARLSHPDAKSAKAAADAGADVILVSTVDAKVVTSIVEAVGSVPCGVILDKDEGIDLGALKEAGCDFVVISPCAAPAAWLRQEGLSKVARVIPTTEMVALRGIDRVGVDAVVLDRDGEGDFVSVQFLMTCHFLRGALSKPLLAMIPPGASEEDAGLLWDAGVDGLVVDVAPGRLKDLHKAVTSLPPRTRKRAGKDVPLLPRLAEAAAPAEEEEDGE